MRGKGDKMAGRRWRHNPSWFWGALIGLIGALSILFFAFSEKLVPPWDPTSMVVMAQALAQNHGIQYVDANNSEIGPYFNPHGFDIRAPSDPQPYSAFPPGLSLILAGVYKLTGRLDLLYVVTPLLNIVGLIAIAYLGYILSGRWGSLFAILLVGSSRVIGTFATSLWSDGPSLSLLLAGMALALWAVQTRRKWIVVVAGICLGGFILFKFVNVAFVVLVLAGLVVFGREDTRRFGWWLLPGVLAGVAGMFIYQATAYGSPWANAYQAWGQNLYNFPLFSPAYLFFKAPAPWSDISNNAILSGMVADLGVCALLFLVALTIDRKNPLRLLLALIVVVNVALYALSVFTPRQFINMRYLLPALAAAYILAADVLARLLRRLPNRLLQAGLVGLVGIFCFGNLMGTVLPDLTRRNQGTANNIQLVEATAHSLASHSVVLAYSLADTFILYGDLSVLNYRRISAPDLSARNTLVIQAIGKLLCRGQPVYLIQDDDGLFNTLYPDLAQTYRLRLNHTPLPSYEIQLNERARHCPAPDQTQS